jgi:hypothetical protein
VYHSSTIVTKAPNLNRIFPFGTHLALDFAAFTTQFAADFWRKLLLMARRINAAAIVADAPAVTVSNEDDELSMIMFVVAVGSLDRSSQPKYLTDPKTERT